MQQPHDDATARRVQTCPVLTLGDDVQEPCESERSTASTTHRRSLRRALSVGVIALLSAGAIGCNDDENPVVEPPPECEGEECEEPPACEGEECETATKECLAIVSASSEEGSLSVYDVESMDIQTDITTFHHDAGLVLHKNLIYVVNRLGADNIQALDIEDGYATRWQYSVGNSTNPQTMAISGDRGFIPLLGDAQVMIVDLTAEDEASFILDERIDIDPIADWDGSKADVGTVFTHDGVLYVVSQGIGDDWACAPDAHSQLLAFDTETLAPAPVFEGESTLDLALCNAGGIAVVGDTLYVQSIGAYRYSAENPEDDGGIEAIDIATGAYKGVILTETQANESDVFQIYPSIDGTGLWVNLAGGSAFAEQKLHFLDLSGDTPELSPSFYDGYVWSISESEEFLFVTDRTQDREGLYIVNKETRELEISEGIDTGLPPRGSLLFTREGSCF